jgi:hypothetical protein
MAVVDQITLNGVLIICSDTDPTTGAGIAAPIGSILTLTDGSGIYRKSAAGDTAWTLVGIGYTLTANSPSLGDADSTTYYFGAPYTITKGTVAASRRVYIPKAGTIKNIYLLGTCTAGTSESVAFYLRLNNTTDTTISTTVDMSASPYTANATGLSVAVVAGDYFEIKEVTPAWVTNPTAILINVIVYIE